MSLVGVLAVAAVCGVVLRGPITAAGDAFLGRFGLAGLFAGVLLTDSSPLPMTHEPVLLLAVARGLALSTIGAVASAASVAAGPLGWACGRGLRAAGAEARLERRYPEMVAYIRSWGAWGVAIAALVPIPYALATWSAGLLGCRCRRSRRRACCACRRRCSTWGSWPAGGTSADDRTDDTRPTRFRHLTETRRARLRHLAS
ncbi:MAG: hypothetical protein R3F59_26370 [Myxococcota bacterium]